MRQYVDLEAVLSMKFQFPCEQPFAVVAVSDIEKLPVLNCKEHAEDQLEFCAETDCFYNDEAVCLCSCDFKDPAKGQECPHYSQD